MLREEDDPEVLQEAGADVAEKKGEGEDFLRQVQTETALLKDCLDNGIEPKDTEKGPSGEDLDVGGLPDEKELRRLLSVENPSEAFRTETAKSPRGSPPHSNDHLPVTLREALEMRGPFRSLVQAKQDKADHAAHQKDKDWWTPLHWAAQDGHERLAEKLLGLRVSTNAADTCGATPLMIAAFNGRTRIIEALLKDRSTDVRQTNKYLTTALHYAAQRGHAASIEMLVQEPPTTTGIQ
eukprot:g25072.t1